MQIVLIMGNVDDICVCISVLGINSANFALSFGSTGYSALQLVEALRYKPEIRGVFPERVIEILNSLDPGFDSACSRNEYQIYLLGVSA
jgi:hypothetical protein